MIKPDPDSPAGPHLGDWLTPVSSGPWMWVETVLITLLGLLLAFQVRPLDPFFLREGFPWTWLAPVLVALRYGVLPGVIGAGILVAAWWVFYRYVAVAAGDFPALYFFGGFLLVLVCGEYSGAWRTRLRRLDETNAYLDERLARVTRRHYLLRLSHERLEQDLLTRPGTLRDLLLSLRSLVVGQARGESLPAAHEVLDYVAQFCQIESAALCRVLPGGALEAIATVGEPPEVSASDPLVAYALEKGMLAHVQGEGAERSAGTSLLVAAPMVTGDGQMPGLLAISRMPFIALNRDTLQTLSVLLAYYADIGVSAPAVARALAAHPDCPHDFADELSRMARLAGERGLASSMVVFAFGEHPQREAAAAQIARVKRDLDVFWELRREAGLRLAVLMPLSGSAGVEGYLLRIEQMLRASFGEGYAGLQIATVSQPVTGEPAEVQIQRLLAAGR